MKLIADKSFLNKKGKMVKRGTSFDVDSDKEEKVLIDTKLAHRGYETKVIAPKVNYETKVVEPKAVESKVTEVKVIEPKVEEVKKYFDEGTIITNPAKSKKTKKGKKSNINWE